MRLSSFLVALAASASARALVIPPEDQVAVTFGDLDVPGKNPLEFCDADRSADVISIEEVILTPNPPEAYVETEMCI